MTNNDISRRTKDWTKPSAQANRYGFFARASDWWCATRDARKGLPALPPDDPRRAGPADLALTTPRMMLLGQIGLGRIEREWIVYQSEVADLEAALRDSQARRTAVEGELAAARQRLAAVESEPEEAGRVAGEERTDQAIIRQRRAKARAAKLAQEQGAVRSLSGRIDAMDAEIAQRQEQIDIRLRIARRRAAMIEAHIRRRCAAYLTRLVRRHPEGARLNELMRPRWPEQAEWAQANSGAPAQLPADLGTHGLLGRPAVS